MLDRVRESMFGTLAPWIPGARVLDLFAGSGSLGLEALSRGAASARLVERDADAVALLRANVRDLGMEERAEVVLGDALGSPDTLGAGRDVIFFDPPYALVREARSRERLLGSLTDLVQRGLAAEGVLVFHAPRGQVARRDFPALFVVREGAYGTSSLWYVQLEDVAAGAEAASEDAQAEAGGGGR